MSAAERRTRTDKRDKTAERPSMQEIDIILERNLPILSKSMTFAKMLEANRKAFPNLKDLGWLFAPVCNRKDQAALSDVEKERYVCAFNLINNDGTLGQFVDIHAQMHMQHTNERLLPWHRIFVYSSKRRCTTTTPTSAFRIGIGPTRASSSSPTG